MKTLLNFLISNVHFLLTIYRGLGNPADGSNGGDTTEPETGDCNGNGILINPQDPSTNLGDGCNGIVTQPNLPHPNDQTPCEILKANSENPKIQDKIDSLQTRVSPSTPNYDKHETIASVYKYQGQTKYNISATSYDAGTNTQAIEGIKTDFDIATIHNHTVYSSFLPSSHEDVVTFYDTYKFLIPNRKKTYIFYIACYNGVTYALKMNDASAWDAFFAEFPSIGTANFTENEKEFARKKVLKIYEENGFKERKVHTQEEAEKIFLKILNDPQLGSGNGANIYRKDGNTWGKLKLTNGTVTKEDCSL